MKGTLGNKNMRAKINNSKEDLENNVEVISEKEKRNAYLHTHAETEKEKEFRESVRLILTYKYD